MVRRMSGFHALSRSRARHLLRLAAIGAFALALAACGRKGPLDLPPSAAVPNPPPAATPGLASPVGGSPIGRAPATGDTGFSREGRAQAPHGEKKSIPLDVLLN